jgi:hypothetical protein
MRIRNYLYTTFSCASDPDHVCPSLSRRLYKAFTVLAENNKNFTQPSIKTFTDVPYQVSRHENCDFSHVI